MESFIDKETALGTLKLEEQYKQLLETREKLRKHLPKFFLLFSPLAVFAVFLMHPRLQPLAVITFLFLQLVLGWFCGVPSMKKKFFRWEINHYLHSSLTSVGTCAILYLVCSPLTIFFFDCGVTLLVSVSYLFAWIAISKSIKEIEELKKNPIFDIAAYVGAIHQFVDKEQAIAQAPNN